MVSCNYRFLGAVLLLLGCSETSSTASTPEAVTLVGLDPQDFIAKGACGTQVQRYVATLTDVTGADGIRTDGVSLSPFVVGSSKPMPCTDSITFAKVVDYHAYKANIDGYNRKDIEPAADGSPAMLAEGQYVQPQWSAICSGWTASDGGTEPGIAYPNITINLSTCTKLGEPQE